MIDYERIANAITYIKENAAEQPSLDEVAAAIHLSPYHFHRLFKKWAGVTPKAFLQYISLNHAKLLLQDNQTIEEASFHSGFSSSSRLHDLFVNIEGMTPGEYKNGGEQLEIIYDVTESPFGRLLIASTYRGICNLLFVEDVEQGRQQLNEPWPNAAIRGGTNKHIEQIKGIFSGNAINLKQIKLHIKGSAFQLKVWEALLKIPAGQLAAYSDVARQIDNPKASRAVGSAIASNPVAWLIPCHRIIKSTGDIGEYHWGSKRKTAMVGWEVAKANHKV